MSAILILVALLVGLAVVGGAVFAAITLWSNSSKREDDR